MQLSIIPFRPVDDSLMVNQQKGKEVVGEWIEWIHR